MGRGIGLAAAGKSPRSLNILVNSLRSCEHRPLNDGCALGEEKCVRE